MAKSIILSIKNEKEHLLVGFSSMYFHQFGNPVRTVDEAREWFKCANLSDSDIQTQLDIRNSIRLEFPQESEHLESSKGHFERELMRSKIGAVSHPIFDSLPEDMHPENINWK